MVVPSHERPRPMILFAADDETVRLVIREALETSGFEVIEAADGRRAVALFNKRRPDLVLLDAMIPQMDGFKTCRAIQNHPYGGCTPLLMIVGEDDMSSIHKAYDAGAADFVIKPVSMVLLVYRLRYMLRSRRILTDLANSEHRLETAQRIARLGNWEYDTQTGALYLSQQTRHIFDLSRQGAHASYQDLFSRVHPDDIDHVRELFENVMKMGCPGSVEHRILLSDGTERYIHQEVESAGGPGGERWLIGAAQDITERKNAEKKIHDLAYYDELTGLPNRSFIREQLKHLVESAKRRNKLLAVLSLDLDIFERINDTLGHDAGDGLLRDVSRRLSICVRAADRVGSETHQEQVGITLPRNFDMVARPSGDEFIVLMTDIGRAENAASLASRINEALTEPFEVRGNRLVLTVSTGIAVYPRDGENAETLLKNADAAMHHAKERGGNHYQFFSAAIHSSAQERLALEASLRQAIENEEFELHYQPKIKIRTGSVVGMEALLRWRHAEFGTVSPAKFIPLAEETGLITSLGEWVLREACLQNKAWQDAGLVRERVAVNVSARQFKDRDFVDRVRRILAETGLDPNYLEIEITEGTLMHDTDANQKALNDLNAMGVSIALDDFGTGYSSMSNLKRFPISTVKIDRSFVRDVTTDLDSAAIVDAIIALTWSVGTNLVAEGVETAAQYEYLRNKGCREVQGFYISYPLSATECADWLQSSRVPELVSIGQ